MESPAPQPEEFNCNTTGNLPLEDLKENVRAALSARYDLCSTEETDLDGAPVTLWWPVRCDGSFFAAAYQVDDQFVYEIARHDVIFLSRYADTLRDALTALCDAVHALKTPFIPLEGAP